MALPTSSYAINFYIWGKYVKFVCTTRNEEVGFLVFLLYKAFCIEYDLTCVKAVVTTCKHMMTIDKTC